MNNLGPDMYGSSWTPQWLRPPPMQQPESDPWSALAGLASKKLMAGMKKPKVQPEQSVDAPMRGLPNMTSGDYGIA